MMWFDRDLRFAVRPPHVGGPSDALGIPVVPCDEAAVERAAKALYEGPDEFGRGRPDGVTWESMLTYDGQFPDNTDHPIADEYRRMARTALRAAGEEV